ncbi:MAG: two-component system nitrate/nitrite response regulator NarL [Cyclobacteriaceae bacterium]|jgi:DNA-binding NarL/FixJ family response regulator
MKKIKVLIVDDHALVRDGLQALLVKAGTIEVVGQACCGQEAIETVKDNHPDVVLMDICMPGMSGLEALQEVKKIAPNVKVILLSMEIDEASILKAVNEGMDGFLPKDLKKGRLVEAINRVYDGEEYFDPRVSDVIFRKHRKKEFSKKRLVPSKKLILNIAAVLTLELIAGILLGFIGI